MTLTSSQLEQLIAQARQDAPNETCGIIGGKAGRALKIYPLQNVAENPVIHYKPDAQALFEAVDEIEWKNDWEVLALYHSHPASPAYPSPTDVRESGLYKDSNVIFILISLMHPKLNQVRGFYIRSDGITEVTLDISDDATPAP